MSVIFITGTDTGVGKTLISKALIDYFVAAGLQVSAMKPIASGATLTASGLRNEDAEILLSSINTPFTYEQVNPYVFGPPIAPHIAAEENNNNIEISVLDKAFDVLVSGSDKLIIEGAGGWQVPLNQEMSFADWVSKKQWPVVLVVGIRLGCINHAILTYLDILQKKNPLLGWVANIVDPELSRVNEVIEYLENNISAPLLGTIPFLNQADQQDLTCYFELSDLV